MDYPFYLKFYYEHSFTTKRLMFDQAEMFFLVSARDWAYARRTVDVLTPY